MSAVRAARTSRLILAVVALVPMLAGCELFLLSSGVPPIAAPSPRVIAEGSAGPLPPATVGALPDGARLASLLGVDDFAAVGLQGAGTPVINSTEPGSAYVVYAGPSAAGGGIELDVFVLSSLDDAAAMVQDPGLFAIDEASKADLGADRAALIAGSTTNDGTATYDVLWGQKGHVVFDIGIPTSPQSHDQLMALGKLVIARSADFQ